MKLAGSSAWGKDVEVCKTVAALTQLVDLDMGGSMDRPDPTISGNHVPKLMAQE